MSGGTDYKHDERYIASINALAKYVADFDEAVEKKHFLQVYAFAEVVKGAVEDSEDYEPPTGDGRPAMAILLDFLPNWKQIEDKRNDMDKKYGKQWMGMSEKTRSHVMGDIEGTMNSRLQGVISGWYTPDTVRNEIFGGWYDTFDEAGNKTGRRFSDGALARVSREYEQSLGGADPAYNVEGLSEWRTTKEVYGAQKRLTIEFLTRPPSQWEEVPERITNIYNFIERTDFTVEQLQGYIQKALAMIESVQTEDEAGRRQLNELNKELKAFQAFHTLRVTLEKTSMDPEQIQNVFKGSFDDQTWQYFINRFGHDSRLRTFLDKDGVQVNLLDEAWTIYMKKFQEERKDMNIVEALTRMTLVKRSGDKDFVTKLSDKDFEEIENFLNRGREKKDWEDVDRKRVGEIRSRLLTIGATSDVMKLMAALEKLGLRREVNGRISRKLRLDDGDYERLLDAIKDDRPKNAWGKPNSFEPWEKERIDYFRRLTSEQIQRQIIDLVNNKLDTFPGLEKDKDPQNWGEAVLDKAFKAGKGWGGANVVPMRGIVDEWYRRDTLLGAYGYNERGQDLPILRRSEMRNELRETLSRARLKVDGQTAGVALVDKLLKELEDKGFLEAVDANALNLMRVFAWSDFDGIRVYGTNFKTKKVAEYPQAYVFNNRTELFGGRMIDHYMDFLVDEERGRSYEEDEVNGVFRGFLPGEHHNLLPQNRSMVRVSRFFYSDEQLKEIERRANLLMKKNNFLPAEKYRAQIEQEIDKDESKPERDPYFNGFIGWARSAVIAEMIDSGDIGIFDFSKTKFSTLAGKINQYFMIDLYDDRKTAANYFGRKNMQEYLKNPTNENFLRINDGKEVFYSGRNVRIWPWTMIATRAHWEISHKLWKKLGLREQNMQSGGFETVIEGVVENGAMRKEQGDLLKNELLGMGSGILGTLPFRRLRQGTDFVRIGLWETIKAPGTWLGGFFDLLKRIFGYGVGGLGGK